jgi:RNA polymerase sigma factor (sigma-70 family)
MMAQQTMQTEDLVLAAKDGDVVAFAELLRRHQSSVFAMALATAGDRLLAEDVVQETFMIAWRDLSKLRDVELLQSWLCGIARNVARGHKRRSAREVPGEIEEERHGETPLQNLLERDAETSLAELVQRVPSKYREAMLLHYGAEKTVGEVARCLRISEAAVKKRLSRGKDLLRERASRFSELASACRVPAALAPAIIATISAKSAAAHASGGAITSLTVSGVVMKKTMLIAGALALCLLSLYGALRLTSSEAEEKPSAAPTFTKAAEPAERPALAKKTRFAIVGAVVDKASGEPIPHAAVVATPIDDGDLASTIAAQARLPDSVGADEDGRFELRVPADRYYISASAPGYRGVPLLVEAADDTEIELTLEKGGVRVHGTVSDVLGGPVAGALIRAMPEPGLPGSRPTGALSDESGRYEVWLEPGAFELRAEHSDYAPQEGQVQVGSQEVRRDVRLVPASSIVGVVRNADTGEVVPGALVKVAGSEELMTVADLRGRFGFQRLPAGPLSLVARTDRYSTNGALRLDLAIGESRTDIELLIESAANVSGIVVDKEGAPVADATVALIDFATEMSAQAREPSDSAGRFVIEGMTPGSYGTAVYKEGHPITMLRGNVRILDRDVDDLKLVLTDAASLVGRVSPAKPATIFVTRDGGKGVLGALALSGDLSDFMNMMAAKVRTGDGRFEINTLAPGRYNLVALADDGTRGISPVFVGQDEETTIELAASIEFDGTVKNRLEKPVEGAQVLATTEDIFPPLTRVATTDANGNFHFGGFAKGSYTISTLNTRCQTQTDKAEKYKIASITLGDGAGHAADMNITVEGCDHTVRGTVVDQAGNPVVDAWVTGSEPRPVALTDSDGHFALEGITASKQELRVYHPRAGNARVEIAAGQEEIEVRLQKWATLRVRATLNGRRIDRFEAKVFRVGGESTAQFARDGETFYSNLAAGNYLIDVDAEDASGKAEISLDWANSEELDIEIKKHVRVRGTLLTEDGEPATGYSVVPVRSQDLVSGRDERAILAAVSALTDATGSFALRDVHPDSNVLVGASPGGTFCGIEVELAPSGESDLGEVVCRPKKGK